jgi:hypothetical protein
MQHYLVAQAAKIDWFRVLCAATVDCAPHRQHKHQACMVSAKHEL